MNIWRMVGDYIQMIQVAISVHHCIGHKLWLLWLWQHSVACFVCKHLLIERCVGDVVVRSHRRVLWKLHRVLDKELSGNLVVWHIVSIIACVHHLQGLHLHQLGILRHLGYVEIDILLYRWWRCLNSSQ